MLKVAWCALALCLTAGGDAAAQDRRGWQDKFRQLDESWPTAGATRTASGAPGRDYWQQRVDYDIKVTLDEAKRAITGAATITYANKSPDTLKYLWLNLDQNQLVKGSDPVNARTNDGDAKIKVAGSGESLQTQRVIPQTSEEPLAEPTP